MMAAQQCTRGESSGNAQEKKEQVKYRDFTQQGQADILLMFYQDERSDWRFYLTSFRGYCSVWSVNLQESMRQ